MELLLTGLLREIPMNSKNISEGTKMAFDFVFGVIGLLFLAITAFVIMVVFSPVFIWTRFERHWNEAKKKEEDWMSKREDYLSGK